MKNETLIDCPKYKITEAGCSCNDQKGCKYKQAVETIQELVEKATPKKPIYEADGYDGNGELLYDTAYCPNCNKFYELDYGNWGHRYCPICGQTIDWE